MHRDAEVLDLMILKPMRLTRYGKAGDWHSSVQLLLLNFAQRGGQVDVRHRRGAGRHQCHVHCRATRQRDGALHRRRLGEVRVALERVQNGRRFEVAARRVGR